METALFGIFMTLIPAVIWAVVFAEIQEGKANKKMGSKARSARGKNTQ